MRKPAARPAPAAPRPDPLAELRDRRGEPPAAFTATDAKKRFGRVLEMVLRGGAVVITRHDAPKAILISVMQTPKARARMKAAFDASPKEVGRAAVAAARKRG